MISLQYILYILYTIMFIYLFIDLFIYLFIDLLHYILHVLYTILFIYLFIIYLYIYIFIFWFRGVIYIYIYLCFYGYQPWLQTSAGAADLHGERGAAAFPGAATGAAEGACSGHPHARGHWLLADLGKVMSQGGLYGFAMVCPRFHGLKKSKAKQSDEREETIESKRASNCSEMQWVLSTDGHGSKRLESVSSIPIMVGWIPHRPWLKIVKL